ncbi:hypothetical protein [Sphingobium sp. LMC3-1-1.1]|uniref:hypothetical protein n=1 Tax=unclassified Sphingobium TaxID=2611147 RepID=UPI0034302A8F
MRRHVASAALLNLSLIVGASAQTAPPRAPSPPAAPKMDCPMHDRAGGHMMQSGAMPMQQGRPMPGAMEHCRAMHDPAERRQQHQMMHHPGEPPVSQKQEKDK